MKKAKGLIVYILKDSLSDCSNGGLSSKATEALLVGEGIDEVFEQNDEQRPTFKLVKRNIIGRDYLHAQPIDRPEGSNFGWMAGGNFIWTSDSRFPNDYPIAIHDRQETPELHETLSR